MATRRKIKGSISARTFRGLRTIAEKLQAEKTNDTLVDESVGGPINHPRHYNTHPSGVECISIIRWENHNLGAVIAYIWRLRDKPLLKRIEDLKKAEFYIHDEIERLEGMARNQEARGVTLERSR